MESRNSLLRLSILLGIGFVFNVSILTTSVRIRSVNNAALYHGWWTTVELIKTFDLVSLFGLSLLESYFPMVEKFPKVKRANESSSLEYASLRTLILRANISYARWKSFQTQSEIEARKSLKLNKKRTLKMNTNDGKKCSMILNFRSKDGEFSGSVNALNRTRTTHLICLCAALRDEHVHRCRI